MMAIIFALVTYFFWGTGDIFGTVASRKIGGMSATFWMLMFGFIIYTLYIPFAFQDILHITPQIFFICIILGIFLLIGNVAVYEGLQRGNASLVGTISGSAYTGLVVVLSTLIFKDVLSLQQIVSIVVIFIGVILCSVNIQNLKKSAIFKDKGIPLALIAMFCWGIQATLVRIPIKQVGWFWPNYIALCLFPLIYFYLKIRKTPLQKPNIKKAFIPLLLTALFLHGGEFTFNMAIGSGFTSIVSPIAGAYPTLFALLAFIIFRDPISKQQKVGIFTTLIGIVAISFFSV